MAKSEEDQHLDIPQNIGMNNSNVLSLYMDQTINNALVREVRNMTKQFNVKSLISIVFLMGIDNLKKYVNHILTKLPDYFKTMIMYLYESFYKPSKSLSINTIDINNELNNISDYKLDYYTIKINESFEELFLDYIVQKNNNVKYDENIYEYNVISKNKFRYFLQLDNIILNFKNYNIYFSDIFDINYIKFNNDIKNVISTDKESMSGELLFLNRLTSVLNLPYNRQKDVCKKIHSYIMDNTNYGNLDDKEFNNTPYLLKMVQTSDSLEKFKSVILNGNKIFNGLHNNVVKNCNCSNNYKIIVLITISAIYVQFYLEFNSDFSNLDKIFGYNVNKTIKISHVDLENGFMEFFKELFTKEECRSIFYSLSSYEYNKNKPYFKEIYGKSKDMDLNLKIFKDGINLDEIETINVAEEFIHYLYSMNHKDSDNNDIDVYNINITRKEIILNEYEPSKLLEKKLEDGTIEKIMIPEKPKEISIKVEAVMDKINTIYKDFSTLYLKEKDEFKLKNILDTFDKKKDLYKKIGIPFKFSCLLYGSPGTGKTSAIKSISSYLKRDIYYLDISKIKTNDELTKVFKDINENTKDNGVIVMEDIDAMSDIVLEREDKCEKEINTDDQLTLSHLLNILDGTLTRDDMIFIATTNYINKIDKALKRPGRFDIIINLSECDRYQYSIIYKSILQRELSSELLDKLEAHKITPAKFIYSLIQYIGYNDDEICDDDIITNLLESLD